MSTQNLAQDIASRSRATNEPSRKSLHIELAAAIKALQTHILREEGNEREVAEQFKIVSRVLDQAIERTRRRPEPRDDQEWAARKERLAKARERIMETFQYKRKAS